MLAQADSMTGAGWIWAVVAVVVILAILWYASTRRRSAALRERFGPEYDRTVASTGSPQRAEAELAQREKRVRALDLQPLTPGARDRYSESWRRIQARFVDDPDGAVGDADRLITEAMRDRGYPVDEPAERRMSDLSVEHAGVLDNYRTATAIAQRNARGEAPTEELRHAMVSYRALFADLVGTDPVSAKPGTVEGRIVEPRRTDPTQQGVRRS